MSKKFYIILIYIICLWIAIPFSAVSAQISVEVLIYTGKISVASQNEASTTYAIPQEITKLPTNTILECIDGVAIFKIGDVQVVLQASDKLQISSIGKTENFSMICISGEIEAMWGEDFFKLDQGETLELSSEGIPIIEQVGGVDSPLFDNRNKQSSPAIIPPDPDESIYTSTYF